MATIQQLAQLVAPVAFSDIYKATLDEEIGPIHGLAYIVAASASLLSTLCICLTPMPSTADGEDLPSAEKGAEGGYSDPLLPEGNVRTDEG